MEFPVVVNQPSAFLNTPTGGGEAPNSAVDAIIHRLVRTHLDQNTPPQAPQQEFARRNLRVHRPLQAHHRRTPRLN
jgi:hypothetical protein